MRRMRSAISSADAQAAAALRASHPNVPPVEVLELLLQSRRGETLNAGATWVLPSPPFGQVIAAAFDRGMSPWEWAVMSVPPTAPLLREALATIWRDTVLQAFAVHFGLVLVD